MIKYKKILSGCLVSLMLISGLAGCSVKNENSSLPTTSSTNSTMQGTETKTNISVQTSQTSDQSKTGSKVAESSRNTGTTRSGMIKTLNVNRKIKAITSEGDRDLLYNPERGFRHETFVNVANKGEDYQTVQLDPTDRLRAVTQQYTAESPQLAQVYFYLTGYKNTPTIAEYGINRMQEYMDYARELKIKLMVRFAYQGDMDGVGEASDQIMLSHMKQLKTFLERNKDVIHTVQAGFLGAWGEWHSYKMAHDRVKILRAIVDMTPAGIYVQVRLPEFKNIIPSSDPIYKRLSFHNDSIFGVKAGGTGGVDPGTDSWNQITREAAYSPVDGEMFWGSWSLNQHGNDRDGFLIDGFKVVKQLSEHRFTSMSIHHNYIEDGPSKKYSMQYWQETEIKEYWLKSNNILYAPGWFKDSSDKTIKRTVFDFVRDYMGYKLEAQNWKATGKLQKNGNVVLELSLVNYGFSAPYNLESGFAVLDENNRIVISKSAGTPTSWHSRNPNNYDDGKLLTHKIGATCKLPGKAGRYKIAFYLKNSLDVGAKLGNDIPFENGFNILEQIEIA